MSTNILVRRSNLLVPLSDSSAVADCWRSDADAITLDLDAVPAKDRPRVRTHVEAAVGEAGRAAAEVFVRVDKTFLHADLEASVWPGLAGIVLPRIESAAEVREADDAVSALERRRGLSVGSLVFIVEIETARAVWDIRSILQSSPRISQMGLNEGRLAANLGFELRDDLDPFEYARGRLVVETIASGVSPIGMSYPQSARPREDTDAAIHAAASKAKNLGMKGIVCPYASWVDPVNRAFTPTAELVEWNRRVREAFAAGVAAGTAAVPLDGKMIDVPVDEWAIVVLAMAEACARRDAQKQSARASHPA
jgi:citrate lyase subunit beta/citryl-CoA lyase